MLLVCRVFASLVGRNMIYGSGARGEECARTVEAKGVFLERSRMSLRSMMSKLAAQRPGHARNVHCAAARDVFSVLASVRTVAIVGW